MIFVFILKKSIDLEQINCNSGEKYLSRYLDDFCVGCKKAFLEEEDKCEP